MANFKTKLLTKIFLISISAHFAWAQDKGPVTPNSVKYVFNSAQITTVAGENYSLFSSPVQHTFLKSDPDFANTEIAGVTIGYGRYKSVSLCFSTSVELIISGAKYYGASGDLFNNGATIYGQSDGTVDDSNPGAVHSIVVTTSSSDQNCTETFFRNPLCVTQSGTTGCESGDQIYTAEGKINPNTGELDLGSGAAVKLQISFLMDMLNGVIVNADTGEVTTAPAVKITLGKPGAAIHLGKWDGGGATDVSLIFGNDGTLLSANATEYPGTHAAGHCNGGSTASVTAVPSGSPLATGINFITYIDSSTGLVAYPATASCSDSSNCTPMGFNIFTNVLQEVGQTTTVSCVDSSDGSVPQYLKDFTYQGTVGSGEAGTPSFEIKRIVDPTNLFGICTSSSAGYISGTTSVCTYTGSDSDGY